MNVPRFTLSSAVTMMLAITATLLPAPASAQFSARAARTSSSVVADQPDSMLVASSGGASASDSGSTAPRPVYSPSAKKAAA